VQAAVNDEDTRPLGDRVTVQGAEIIEYAIDATLYLYPGRSRNRSLTLRASLQTFWHADKKIGRDVVRSAISAALHVQGYSAW
jgi:phage-related baseplate assembly protein